MKYNKLLYLLFAGAILLVISCNNQKQKGSDGDGFTYSDEIEISNIEITKSFIYAFPSPGDLLQRIGEENLTYRKDILHAPAEAEKYVTSKEKALNLGIYVADLAYTAMFSRSSEAIEYLEVVQSLSQDVHISTSAFESLLDRAKENIGNSDSLIEISNDLFFQLVEFLEISGQQNTIALVSSGAYIESMNIAFQSVDKFDPDNEIIKQIAELKYPLRNLLDHAESVSEDPNVQSILKYIKELNKTFNELAKESSKGEVKHNEPGTISITGGGGDVLHEEGFNSLMIMIGDIRNFIVNVED
jgi:hypothetical protein